MVSESNKSNGESNYEYIFIIIFKIFININNGSQNENIKNLNSGQTNNLGRFYEIRRYRKRPVHQIQHELKDLESL
jgi:hypothetical protein